MQKLLFFILISLLHNSPLFAQKGTGFVVERIEVRGNVKTKSEVILRTLTIREGGRLTPGLIDANRKTLYQTRLFRTVHLASKPGTEKGMAVVMIYVDEKRFGDLGISLEYSELDGFGIASDAHHVNLWGNGKVIGTELRKGERLKSWKFLYSDPWFFDSNLSIHLKVFSSSADRDLYRNKNPDIRGRYDLERIGGSLGIGQSVGKSYRAIVKYSFEEVEVREFSNPSISTGSGVFAREVEKTMGRKSIAFLSLECHRKPSGNPWGSGPEFEFGLQVDYAAPYLGSIDNFLRIRMEIYNHFEIISNQILTLGGRLGTVFGSPPFYERFYLDGHNQLRGFDRRVIGPEGGTQFFSLEGVYSVSINPVGRVYLFGESAGIRRIINGLNRNQAGATFGIGVLLFERIDISFGMGTGTLIVKSHRFGGINVGL